MLDRPYMEQIRVALIVIAGCGLLIFMGWLTTSERHGLSGILLWVLCYGLPAIVLAYWLQPYVAMLARGLKRGLTMPTTQRGRRYGVSGLHPRWVAAPLYNDRNFTDATKVQFSWRADGL